MTDKSAKSAVVPLLRQPDARVPLALVTLLFVGCRIGLPWFNDGSAIDEYYHIISALDVARTGEYAQIYHHSRYDRGAMMTWWVGLWLRVFGPSIFVAKLAPASLGIINYVLLTIVGSHLLGKTRSLVLLLLVYTVSPWVIFNHFYVRFYVVNETLLLALLVLVCHAYRAASQERYRWCLVDLVAIAVLNGLNLAFTRDATKFFVLLATAVVLAAYYVIDASQLGVRLKADRGHVRSWVGRVLAVPVWAKLLVLGTGAAGAWFSLDLAPHLDFILHGTPPFGAKPGNRYPDLFVEANHVISLFFLAAVWLGIWRASDGLVRLVVITAVVLLTVHLVSNPPLQITRGIMYFMSLYYLVAAVGFDRLPWSTRWPVFVAVLAAFVATTVLAWPKRFLRRPHVRGEISYIDYHKLYSDVAEHCGSATVVTAGASSFAGELYGVKTDYVLSATGRAKSNEEYYRAADGKIRTALRDVEVLTKYSDFKQLPGEVCLIVRTPNSYKFVRKRTMKPMYSEADLSKKYAGLRLYHFPEGALASKRKRASS